MKSRRRRESLRREPVRAARFDDAPLELDLRSCERAGPCPPRSLYRASNQRQKSVASGSDDSVVSGARDGATQQESAGRALAASAAASAAPTAASTAPAASRAGGKHRVDSHGFSEPRRINDEPDDGGGPAEAQGGDVTPGVEGRSSRDRRRRREGGGGGGGGEVDVASDGTDAAPSSSVNKDPFIDHGAPSQAVVRPGEHMNDVAVSCSAKGVVEGAKARLPSFFCLALLLFLRGVNDGQGVSSAFAAAAAAAAADPALQRFLFLVDVGIRRFFVQRRGGESQPLRPGLGGADLFFVFRFRVCFFFEFVFLSFFSSVFSPPL